MLRRVALCNWPQVREIRCFETARKAKGWFGRSRTRTILHLAVDGPGGEVFHQTDEVRIIGFSALIATVSARTPHLSYTWVHAADRQGQRGQEQVIEEAGEFRKVARG